jgi:hypothetical protein
MEDNLRSISNFMCILRHTLKKKKKKQVKSLTEWLAAVDFQLFME